ncbi:hypothetical protein AB0D67_30765 [Streptosporangium sp. NPDC048047]|uniref:hypothetical protein n=1 Tax=Streptosporangium sp. NPDC048047 TaxID=3155748 RepID=UPI003415DC0A
MLHPRTAAVVISSAALLITACATSPVAAIRPAPPKAADTGAAPRAAQQSPLPEVAAQPALIQKEAATVHARYYRLLREISRRGGKGIEQAEAGAGLQMSRAQYRIAEIDKRPRKPPTAVARTRFFIPRPVPGQPRWFLAADTPRGSHGSIHLVFSERHPGEWRVVSGTYTSSQDMRRLPDLAVGVDGLADAVGESSRGTLLISPRSLAQAYARYISTWGKSHRKLFATGRNTSERVEEENGERAAVNGRWSMQLRSRALPGVYSLRTVDGGAVSWICRTQEEAFTSQAPGVYAKFSDPDMRALSGGASFYHEVTTRKVGCYLAVVPTAASGRKVLVVGDWSSWISVEGS